MRLPLLIVLALAACGGGGKTTTSSDSDSGSTTEGISAGTTTDGDPSTSAGPTSSATATSTPATSTTTAQPTTDDPTTSTDPPVCSTLDEAECALADHCMGIFGDPLGFPGCTPGPKFLFCNEIVPCDAVIITVCQLDGTEIYQLQNGCIPPGFEPCDPNLGPCGGACLGLDEQACKADPNCFASFGAPHTTKMGMQCADFADSEFLACDAAGRPCPPAVVTVCPEGQPDTAFDVVTGCVPPGFVPCKDGPLPECQ